MTHKRYPNRWMEEAEIEKHFGITAPLKCLQGLENVLEKRLDGVRTGSLLPRCTSISELKAHIKEVSSCITDGSFITWLQEHTSLRVVEDETSGAGSILRRIN
jgi:hypothetical protein